MTTHLNSHSYTYSSMKIALVIDIDHPVLVFLGNMVKVSAGSIEAISEPWAF